MSWLINATQLDKFRKNQKNVLILDASWHLSPGERDAEKEFVTAHIPGARFLDLNTLVDPTSSLPNTLWLDTQQVSEKLGHLGISKDCKIIFYDNSDMHSSCRALWLFKIYGHNPNLLYVLDGGLKGWKKYGGKIESGESHISNKSYEVTLNLEYCKNLAEMKQNLHAPYAQVIDARHPIRYAGGPEHRKGLRPGHIPNSFSFPFMTMFENDQWKPIEKIRKQLTGIGVDLTYPIITTCGSGMTAATLNFALDLMGVPNSTLYDGSWTEWGAEILYPGELSLSERPVVTSLEN